MNYSLYESHNTIPSTPKDTGITPASPEKTGQKNKGLRPILTYGTLIIGLICFSLVSCNDEVNRNLSSESCDNLQVQIQNLRPGDKITLLYDTRTLFRHKVTSREKDQISISFCNAFRNIGTLKLTIQSDQKMVMDTSLIIRKPRLDYLLDIDRSEALLNLSVDKND